MKRMLADYEFRWELGLMCKIFVGDVFEYYDESRFTAAFGLGFDRENRLLLTTHHRRGWEIPGGRRNPGETIENAMKREFVEETRYEIVDAIPFGWFEMTKDHTDICPIYLGIVGQKIHDEFVDDAVGADFFDYDNLQETLGDQDRFPLLHEAFTLLAK